MSEITLERSALTEGHLSSIPSRRTMKGGLSDDQMERYARHISLPGVGEEGQLLMLSSSVLVIGAGGLGSPALLYLSAAGVGKIGVMDHDSVSLSNLQRQVIHSNAAIGESKAISAARRISELNPDVEVVAIGEKLTHENAIDIFEDFDVILDGTDNFETRYLIGDVCEVLEKPWVFGSIHRFEGQVSTFNLKGGPNYRDLFPQSPPPELAPNCAEAGVLGVLPGIVGTIQATEALKIILNIGETLDGNLLTINAKDMDMRKLSFNLDASRERVSSTNFPTQVSFAEISPIDFVERSNDGWAPFLLDVRGAEEEQITTLDGTDLRIQHLQVPSRIHEIPQNKDIVVYCRIGSRSAAIARLLVESGRPPESIYNLFGGIHLWADTVDSSIIKY